MNADESTSSSSSVAPKSSKKLDLQERWVANLTIITLKKMRDDLRFPPNYMNWINTSIQNLEDDVVQSSPTKINDSNTKIELIAKGKQIIQYWISKFLLTIPEKKLNKSSKNGEKMNEENIEELGKRQQEKKEEEEEEVDINKDCLIKNTNNTRNSIQNLSTTKISTFDDWISRFHEINKRNEIAWKFYEKVGEFEIKLNEKKEWAIKRVLNAAKKVNDSRSLIQELRYEGDILIDKKIKVEELYHKIDKVEVKLAELDKIKEYCYAQYRDMWSLYKRKHVKEKKELTSIRRKLDIEAQRYIVELEKLEYHFSRRKA